MQKLFLDYILTRNYSLFYELVDGAPHQQFHFQSCKGRRQFTLIVLIVLSQVLRDTSESIGIEVTGISRFPIGSVKNPIGSVKIPIHSDAIPIGSVLDFIFRIISLILLPYTLYSCPSLVAVD